MTSLTGNRDAFTFIEVLIVVSIMSVISFLSYPSLSRGISDFSLSCAVRKAVTLCGSFRNRAVAEGRIVSLEVLPDGFRTAGDRERRLFPFPGSIRLSCTEKTILFFPDGAISEFEMSISNGRSSRTIVSGGLDGSVRPVT